MYSWKVIHSYNNDTLIKQIEKYFKNIGIEAKKFLYLEDGKAVLEVLESECKKNILMKKHKTTLNSDNNRVIKE